MTVAANNSPGWGPNPGSRRTLKFLLADGLGLSASLCLAFLVHFDFNLPADCMAALPSILAWVVLSKLVLFYCFRQFHILPDFFGLRELKGLALAVSYSMIAILLIDWRYLTAYSPPRSVFIVDALLSLFFLAGLRTGLKLRHEQRRDSRKAEGQDQPIKRVGIVGAGEAGAILASELVANRRLGLEPVVFFDDDARKWEASIHGIRVAGRPEILLGPTLGRLNLDEIIISMPSAPPKRIREVIEVLQQAGLKFRTVPSLTELAMGRVQVSQIRSVEVEDLLGRLPVQLATDEIRALLRGQRVMVTGAGGSIGSELCRQIAGFEPAQLLLVERSEVAMFAIEQELLRAAVPTQIRPFVADILDTERLRRIFEETRPHVVFHAAAHKHVPMMEMQPAEAVRNNSIGTANLASVALEFNAERFILISTDKAINPTSVMGASKRLAELYLQSLHAANPSATRFMAVRFGNVLGSSGSVIPIFKKQIAAGGPVTVTHRDMTRYFMTIPEAVGLVLQSAVQGQGGEVFVLDMGKPMKILDLARQLIQLSGFEPEKDIAIEFVGLRPGEKLFEELNLDRELHLPTAHSKIMRLRAEPLPLSTVTELLARLAEKLYSADQSTIRSLLMEAVPEFRPSFHPAPSGALIHKEGGALAAPPQTS